MDFDFATLLIVLASQTLLLAAVVFWSRPGIRAKWAVAAFSAASGLYVWFHVLSEGLSPLARQQLGAIFANETLPGALLLVFVYGALFDVGERRIRWILLLPLLELIVRLGAPLLLGKDFALPPLALAALGQFSILLFSAFALWLLIRHRVAYLMQSADNRLSAVYLYVSPALAIFVINLAWICVQWFGGEASFFAFRVLFVLLLSLTLVWQLLVLFFGNLSFYQVNEATSPPEPRSVSGDPAIPHADREDRKGVRALDLERIISTIRDQELFLDPNLTLIALARKLGTNRASLSHLINSAGEVNFNRFINEFRVERARRLLETSEQQIIDVAFDCGFNSKATFNRVFRQLVGETPSRYRSLAIKPGEGDDPERLDTLELR